MLHSAGDDWTIEEAAHLLNRAGFGSAPEETKALHALGRAAAVRSLVEPAEDVAPVPEWAQDGKAETRAQARRVARQEMRRKVATLSPEAADKLRRETFRGFRHEEQRMIASAQAWWFRRMLRGKAPLREKMVLFWHDHFATSARKVRNADFVFAQNQLFRRHALGNFRELTQAVVLDPAMLVYLDAQNSQKGKPNENLARELFELFTLGPGNYTEQDIREAARALTGYRLTDTGVVHRRRQWDESPKTVFGKTAPYDAQSLVELIFSRSEPAMMLAKKLWAYFASDTPNDDAIRDLARRIWQAKYDIRPALHALFMSREFYAPETMHSQIKCPIHFLIAMLKQLEITEPPVGFPIAGQEQLGQMLFVPPNVAGWDWGKAWINTNTLLTRYNLAGYLTNATSENKGVRRLASPEMRGMMSEAAKASAMQWQGPDYEKIAPRPLRENPESFVDALIARLFQGPVPAEARASFIAYAKAKQGVVFTNKETAELCHLMLSTPYYQLC